MGDQGRENGIPEICRHAGDLDLDHGTEKIDRCLSEDGLDQGPVTVSIVITTVFHIVETQMMQECLFPRKIAVVDPNHHQIVKVLVEKLQVALEIVPKELEMLHMGN